MTERTTLVGEEELERKLANPTWATQPAHRFLLKWALYVEGEAKRNIRSGIGGWLDSGTTRRSITHEVDRSKFPEYARVGSNQKTARWGELGTGLLSEDPESSHRRYFPPPAALDRWAIKRGFHIGTKKAATAEAAVSPGTYGYLVARIIWIRGGTKPRRFLRNAQDEAERHLPRWLNEFAADVENSAERAS